MQARKIVRIFVFFFRSRRYPSRRARQTCTRTKRTLQPNGNLSHTIVTSEIYVFIPKKWKEEKISSFFLGFLFFLFRFIFFKFYSYGFFLSLFFFSAKLTKLEGIVILSLSSCFILVKHPPYNIFWLTFNPYSFDIFVISTYFITTSCSIRQIHDHTVITIVMPPFGHHRTRSPHNLYFQASLYINYFINILLISVPQP